MAMPPEHGRDRGKHRDGIEFDRAEDDGERPGRSRSDRNPRGENDFSTAGDGLCEVVDLEFEACDFRPRVVFG